MDKNFILYFVLIGIGIFLFYKNKSGMKPLVNFNILNNFTEDLTEKAAKGGLDPVIGRELEIERLVQILSRRSKNNPLIIGAAGVGKTAIVEGLALRIVTGDIPPTLQGKRVLKINLADVMGGTKYRGELEERIKSIMDSVIFSKRNIILFIDEFHSLIQTKGTEGAMNASDIIKPALARGDLQLIGATTIDEFSEYLQKDQALLRRFQLIEVKAPDVNQTIAILQGLKKQYEDHHGVKFSDESIVEAVKLSDKYIKNRNQPDKSIDLIDEAGVFVNFRENDLPDNSLKLIRAAADEVHRRIKKSPIQIQSMMQELEVLKRQQEKNILETQKEKIAKKILLLTTQIEKKERRILSFQTQGKVPVVLAGDIVHVVATCLNMDKTKNRINEK
ncbi:MAG: AAA family ATPase [Patescibacteria group bacterium]